MGPTVRCSRCGREAPGDSRYCPGCGADLRDPRTRPATGLLTTNQRLRNRYVIVQKLAQGGQSAVYLVMDTLDSGKQRVVKEMSESNLGPLEREKAISDFMREANMLSQLDHPALAKVYDIFLEDQKHFLVMEYVRGHNLEDELIQAGRPLEWERVVAWGVALCDVLTYLHSWNPPIIYRDLKPANVMLTPEGSIKLVDFGIARWLHQNRARDTALLGTDGYAPLEQYNGHSEPRSDLYGLGASLYHLLTGRVPEAAPLRLAGQTLTPIRSINSHVPESVERVVHRSLNLQSNDRFASASQMREALEWSRQVVSPTTGQIRPSFGPAPTSRRLTASPAIGASGLISRSTTPPVTPARLHIWPLRLDAGFLEMNQTVDLHLALANRGGGHLTGHTETNMPCLTVEPAAIDASVVALQVRVNATGLRPGSYVCHLAVRTNGGDQIIPVRFEVRPPDGTIPVQHRTSF